MAADDSSANAVDINDAQERLTYALLVQSPSGVASALADLDLATGRTVGEVSEGVENAVIEADPVTAAGLGWLSLQELEARVTPEPTRYLSDEEAELLATRGPSALRLVVSSRIWGQSLAEAERQLSGREQYVLAARADKSNENTKGRREKLLALLRDQGLISEDDIDPS